MYATILRTETLANTKNASKTLRINTKFTCELVKFHFCWVQATTTRRCHRIGHIQVTASKAALSCEHIGMISNHAFVC